jgi:hypothetical protein
MILAGDVDKSFRFPSIEFQVSLRLGQASKGKASGLFARATTGLLLRRCCEILLNLPLSVNS